MLGPAIAMSEAAKQYVGRYFPGDRCIVPNGVDTITCRSCHFRASTQHAIRNLPAVRGVVNKIDVVKNGYGRTAGPDPVIGRA